MLYEQSTTALALYATVLVVDLEAQSGSKWEPYHQDTGLGLAVILWLKPAFYLFTANGTCAHEVSKARFEVYVG